MEATRSLVLAGRFRYHHAASLVRVRAACAAYEARPGSVVMAQFIDARPKAPASRLTASIKPRGNR